MKKKLPELDTIFSALSEDTFIGRGGNASVYRIQGHSEYALRVPNHLLKIFADVVHEPNEIEDPLFQGRNFGQPLVEYGDGITLLYLQEGMPVGVPPYLRNGSKARPSEENDITYAESTKIAAEMPLEAYIEMLEDVKFLRSIDKRFDPSKSNNMLMDIQIQRFKFVDIMTKNPGSDYDNCPQELVTMLFDNSYAWQYKGDQADEIQENRINILNKIILAAERLEMPLSKNEAEEDASFSYSLTLAGYEKGSAERLKIVDRIDQISGPTHGTKPSSFKPEGYG